MGKKLNFRNFCFVGLGKHSTNNLIPNLKKANKKIVGYVTRTPKINNRSYKRYKNIDLALKKIPKKTNFVIASPPETHFDLLKKLVKKKSIIYCEKPIFVKHQEAKNFIKSSRKNNSFVIELFMYKYTDLFKKFSRIIKSYDNLLNINCKFLVPSYPKNTFRNSVNLRSSCLYDIGSYIIDLFTELDFNLHNFEIVDFLMDDGYLKKLSFKFNINNISCFSEIGLDKKYENEVTLKTKDKKEVSLSPFFFGREGPRKIKCNKKETFLYEKNSFEKIFRLKLYGKFNRIKTLNKMQMSIKYLDELADLLQKEIIKSGTTQKV